MNHNLSALFFRSSVYHSNRLAMVGDGDKLTYCAAAGYAGTVAAALGPAGRRGARVAIVGSRSIGACLAVLGVCWSGATYVPLGIKLPEQRLTALLQASNFDAIIADAEGEKQLTDAVLDAAPARILLTDRHGLREWPGRAVWRVKEPCNGSVPAPMSAEDLAYVEYTSGTTGVPKGVMIPTASVHAFLAAMQSQYRLSPEDRVAETTDLSFDVSVSNMFLTWSAGASLHIITGSGMFSAVKFVRENELTMWFSVPSVIALLQRTKTLAAGCMPSLRYSFFAGEPLPAAAAEAWRDAAPNSVVDNLYGPTEATIVCIGHRVARPPRITPGRGVVALGHPFPGMEAAILDEALRFVPRGVKGQIALSGPQLSAGYWKLPELTAAKFPVLEGRRWYLTGDFGVEEDDGVFHHLGRIDNQVKVRGNRVELEEIDVHLRRAGQTFSAAAVAWPMEHGSASGIVAFVAGSAVSTSVIAERIRAALPNYMVPSSIIELDSLPLNAAGKIDRRALVAQLETKAA
jgi:D-alanine--poly(phosphoribitol) ligase subunit 1